MLKKMNLPNKLTILRILLVPAFIVFMELQNAFEDAVTWPKYVALGIFVFAALTDFLDGYISRKNNMVTKFGKIMDPLADKLLISTAFIMLAASDTIPAWIAAIVVFRDLFVDALRMFGTDKGKDIAATLSGKIKTAFQLIGIILAILDKNEFAAFFTNSMKMSACDLLLNICMTVAITVAVLATACSLVDYIARFKEDIDVEE